METIHLSIRLLGSGRKSETEQREGKSELDVTFRRPSFLRLSVLFVLDF